MEQLQETAGVNAMDIGFQVAFAFQATLIIFFVVSPVMGYFLARGIKSRVNFVLSWCCGTLVTLVGSFGLSLLLRRSIPQENLPDVAIALLSGLASMATGILLARYLVWWLAEPGKAAWVIEHDKLQTDELMPFEIRRRQEMERRKRR
jgi:hypothetical protein